MFLDLQTDTETSRPKWEVVRPPFRHLVSADPIVLKSLSIQKPGACSLSSHRIQVQTETYPHPSTYSSALIFLPPPPLPNSPASRFILGLCILHSKRNRR